MPRPANVASLRRWRPYTWSDRSFIARPWSELLDWYWPLAERRPEYLALIEIIDSVAGSDAAAKLLANYTIGGLHIADARHSQPPYSAITVGTYCWATRSQPVVAMWHQAGSGLRDEVVRPIDLAVPLFWRFAHEKFDIAPGKARPHTRRARAAA